MTTAETRGPLAVTRRQQLLDALQEQGTVRVSDLTDVLGVTPVTVRRDIAQLAREGLVRRVHGGATLVATSRTPTTTPATDGSPPLLTQGPGVDGPPSGSAATPLQQCLGVLVPSLDYYWPEVVRGAEETATPLGLRLVMRASSYDADDDRPQLERLLEQEGLAGILVAPRTDTPSFGETLEWLSGTGVPLVLVERSATAGQHDAVVESVTSDHVLGAGMAVRHLTALGHRRVALVVSEHSPTSRHLHRGWLEASRESGLDPTTTIERWVPDNRSAELDAALDEVLDACLATGTTAVLAHADAEAMALVQRCEARGLSVPRDLSVVAYDDEVAALFHPALTAVRPPRRSVGRAAVELLAARIQDPARPTHRVVISPDLRVRGSSGPPPA